MFNLFAMQNYRIFPVLPNFSCHPNGYMVCSCTAFIILVSGVDITSSLWRSFRFATLQRSFCYRAKQSSCLMTTASRRKKARILCSRKIRCQRLQTSLRRGDFWGYGDTMCHDFTMPHVDFGMMACACEVIVLLLQDKC